MTKRIYIGKKSSRMGFWVSAPGYDASQEVGKWLVNSDYDQLKLLHALTAEVTATINVGGLCQYFGETAVSWPSLDYVPLCFVTIRGQAYSKQYYPFHGSVWEDSGTQTFGSFYWEVFRDHLEISTSEDYQIEAPKVEVACHVFANDLSVTVL